MKLVSSGGMQAAGAAAIFMHLIVVNGVGYIIRLGTGRERERESETKKGVCR